MKLWVTRTAPDAHATATRLRALGHEPVVAPLLEVVSDPSSGGIRARAGRCPRLPRAEEYEVVRAFPHRGRSARSASERSQSPIAAAATATIQPAAPSALAADADEVVCPWQPEPFGAVGLYYRNFEQTSDAEVRGILERSPTRRAVEPW